MHASHLLAFALSLATSEAATKGFNYGSTAPDGSYMDQEAFESAFETASNLVGASDFNSARLYTMIQGGTTNDPISAIPAAIAANTTLLLGLWASAGDADFDNEVEALSTAIKDYGAKLGKLVVGISVGSEDLYRNSVMGIEAKAGIGANPDTLVGYINKVKSTIAGTALSSARIGHVDTWTGWTNSSNNAVIDACDWIGVDAYPYFQSTMTNPVQDGKALIQSAISQTQAAVGSKEIWITETGWPVSGDTQNLAVASVANAKTYWDDVGCGLLFEQTNTWWYILQDADATSTPSPSFGIVGTTLSTTPLFNLTCPAVTASSTANATTSASGSNSTSSGSNPDSGSSTGTGSSSNGTKTSGSSSSSSPSSSTSAKSAAGTLTTSILASALVLVAAFAAL